MIPRPLAAGSFIHSANFIKGDARDAEGLARAINGHEIILHLAAKHEDFGISRSEYMNANEGGARAVVRETSKSALSDSDRSDLLSRLRH